MKKTCTVAQANRIPFLKDKGFTAEQISADLNVELAVVQNYLEYFARGSKPKPAKRRRRPRARVADETPVVETVASDVTVESTNQM